MDTTIENVDTGNKLWTDNEETIIQQFCAANIDLLLDLDKYPVEYNRKINDLLLSQGLFHNRKN